MTLHLSWSALLLLALLYICASQLHQCPACEQALLIWCWITSLIYSPVCFQENALSVLSLCCCWVRHSDIFNLPLWSPSAPSCPWMPATSKGRWLWAMEIWGEVFCSLWSFRYPPCKYSWTHAYLITRALWNPTYLRKIKSLSMPGYHETLLYRSVAVLERWAFHPHLFALLGLCLVSKEKAAGLWSQITARGLTQLTLSLLVLVGLHNSWTHAGSPSAKQKNVPVLVSVDRPLESLLTPQGTGIIALLSWNSCHGGWHKGAKMLPSISSILFPFHQKYPRRQESHGWVRSLCFWVRPDINFKVNQFQREEFWRCNSSSWNEHFNHLLLPKPTQNSFTSFSPKICHYKSLCLTPFFFF